MSIDDRLAQGPLRVRTLWDEDSTAALPRRTLELRRRRFVLRGVLTGAAVAAACLLAWGGLRSKEGGSIPSEPLQTSSMPPGTSAIEPRQPGIVPSALGRQEAQGGRLTEKAIVLADGSEVATELPSRVELTLNTPHAVIVVVEEGVASFFVSSAPERTFVVEARDLVLRPEGGSFEVHLEKARTGLLVHEGQVRLRVSQEERVLKAGSTHWFPHVEGVSAKEEPASGRLGATDGKGELGGRDASASSWRVLAKKADYVGAYAAMTRHPETLGKSSAELMLAADVARWSQHPVAAAGLLQRVVAEYPADPVAPLAAFTRGRVLWENLGQISAAADAFERARRLAPGGAIAADALAREIDARKAMGQKSEARQLARAYLRSYPQGSHRDQCEKLIGSD